MTTTELLQASMDIHKRKAADYTTNPTANPHENFERSAQLAGWFKHDTDKAYVVLIGTKLARLASLLSSGKEPNNESIEDTFVDLVTYCALWGSKRIRPTIAELDAILNPPVSPERPQLEVIPPSNAAEIGWPGNIKLDSK